MKIGAEGICPFVIIVTPHFSTVNQKLYLFTSCKKIYLNVCSHFFSLPTDKDHWVQRTTYCGASSTAICWWVKCGVLLPRPICGKMVYFLFSCCGVVCRQAYGRQNIVLPRYTQYVTNHCGLAQGQIPYEATCWRGCNYLGMLHSVTSQKSEGLH
jgi:hypothetical protein